MIDWYHWFIAAVLLLWAVSTSRDRNALRIVLIASLASEVIVDNITHQIHGAWKLIIPGALEVATIFALLKWARNRTGITQAGLLLFAWLAHVLCYIDVALKTDIVYSHYEAILLWVSVGQLATCYDTMHFNFQRVYMATAALGRDCVLDVSPAGGGAGLSLVQAREKNQADERECQAIRNAPLVS